MKRKFAALQIIGVLLPFAAYGLVALWFNLAIVPYTDGIVFAASCPDWWRKHGFDSQQWLDVGLLPGFACGICGLVIALWGVKSKSGSTIASGICACIGAPVVVFLYMFATF